MNKRLILNKTGLFCVVVFLALFFYACKGDEIVQNNNNNNNQPPDAPALTEPLNNTVINISDPLLKWNTFPEAASYRIQLSLDANFIGTIFIDSTLSGAELRVRSGLLTTGVNFYWRVNASVNGSGTPWSAVWRFTIVLSPPAPPILLLPPNNSSNQSFLPLFDWDEPPTAQTYHLQVSGNSSFTAILLDSSGISNSQLECPPMVLNTNSQYFWRVRASNSNGLSTGEWSVTFSFTTVPGPEPNSISGTITFADNNFIHLPFFYVSAAFNPQGWPPPLVFEPSGFDSLNIQQSGNTYKAEYKISRLPNGTYYLGVATRDRTLYTGDIFGTYGCDTTRIKFSNCAYTPTPVTITGNNGVENINFLSWADSTKQIFR